MTDVAEWFASALPPGAGVQVRRLDAAYGTVTTFTYLGESGSRRRYGVVAEHVSGGRCTVTFRNRVAVPGSLLREAFLLAACLPAPALPDGLWDALDSVSGLRPWVAGHPDAPARLRSAGALGALR